MQGEMGKLARSGVRGPKSDLKPSLGRNKRSALLPLPYQAGTYSCGLDTAFNSSFSCPSGKTPKPLKNIARFRYHHTKLGSDG